MSFDLARQLDDALREPGFDHLSQTVQDAVNSARSSGGAGAQALSNFLNGTWLGHSLHATLTDFTIGTLLSAGLLDSFSVARDDPGYGDAADLLLKLGLASVIPTAMAGLADWQYQPARGRRFGFLHALINTGAASLLTASLLARRGRGLSGTPASAAIMSGAGLATLMAGAYIGGDLVYRFGIGISQDARVQPIADFTPVIDAAELQEGQPKTARVKGRSIVLAMQGGEIYALDNTCSHAGCGLAQGTLGAGTITCSCHGSTFRLKDGSIVTGPATSPQHAYEARVQGGKIEVRSGPGVWMELS